MDSQKTIEGLEALLKYNHIGRLSSADIEALNFAIDSLKCVCKEEDCISRTIAIQSMEHTIKTVAKNTEDLEKSGYFITNEEFQKIKR